MRPQAIEHSSSSNKFASPVSLRKFYLLFNELFNERIKRFFTIKALGELINIAMCGGETYRAARRAVFGPLISRHKRSTFFEKQNSGTVVVEIKSIYRFTARCSNFPSKNRITKCSHIPTHTCARIDEYTIFTFLRRNDTMQNNISFKRTPLSRYLLLPLRESRSFDSRRENIALTFEILFRASRNNKVPRPAVKRGKEREREEAL